MKKTYLAVLTAAGVALTACGSHTAPETTASEAPQTEAAQAENAKETASEAETSEIVTNLPQIDMTKWLYDKEKNIYYQTGLSYCENPADETLETMGFFVPGDYFKATDNGDGTYTCIVDPDARVGSYTALTAPIVVPINTPGYASMDAPVDTSSSCGYGSIEDYTGNGIILAYAGARGRNEGAPAGITDFKAAIRYTRYNKDLLPGNTDAIFTEGMSGGGAQSAILGASGDSSLYDDYLEAIGAVSGVSDAVLGSMAWCPITGLDVADEAYEWNMGNTRTTLDEEEQNISNELASQFAEYINSIGITDENGNVLTLEASDEGIYQAGSYYNYIKETVETSLDHFLADTEFPYTVEEQKIGPGGMPGRHGGPRESTGADSRNGAPDASAAKPETLDRKGQENAPADIPDGTAPEHGSVAPDNVDFSAIDNISRQNGETNAVTLSGTYETAQDYIDALDQPYSWVTYDEATNTVSITSVADFTKAMKAASKGMAAFDQLDASQGENTLFGCGDGNGAHFDAILADLVTGTEYESAFREDLVKTDALGHTVTERVNMYTPLYYLLPSSEGYETSNTATYWRIRTGIAQGDTSLCTEVNLALAAENYSDDTQVDFETVWGLGHTMAERTGDSTENFINWVAECMENINN